VETAWGDKAGLISPAAAAAAKSSEKLSEKLSAWPSRVNCCIAA
jgi:hypothetical protein